VHHGTFRHEQGNPELSAETGYQLDASALFERKGTRLELNTYMNYFRNFIYLRPTARFSRLPEAGQLFRYTQHDALFAGLEWQWDQKIWGPLYYRSGFEWVYSLNLTEDRFLPFTPPSSYVHSLRYEWQPKTEILSGAITAEHRWTQAQNRVDRNERTTPGYHLFRLQAHLIWDMNSDAHLRWDIELQNAFNTPYLRHLSRYRLLNLPEQGRNLIIRLSYNF
jgi:iron complex outermembrane receptor protein